MHVLLHNIYSVSNLLLSNDLIFHCKCLYVFIDDFFKLNIKCMGMLIEVNQEVFVGIFSEECMRSNGRGEDMGVIGLIKMLHLLWIFIKINIYLVLLSNSFDSCLHAIRFYY